MTALVLSLKRIWSATNRVPHQTRWGTAGSLPLTRRASDHLLRLLELGQCSMPSIVAFTLNLLR